MILEKFWEWEELKPKCGTRKDSQWFQQDGATPHTVNSSLQWLKEHFKTGGGAGEQEMWNLLAAPLSGPITVPPNFYLWGYLKERVYSTKPRTITELKEGITEEI